MIESISPATLRAMLSGKAEMALLDVREEGLFALSHIFFATLLPLSWLELRIRALVPRWKTPVVLTDGGEGLAARAARKLREIGYRDVCLLDGGNPGWEAAGYALYSGVNVPSKAFGEFVEHTYKTPSISAGELQEMLEQQRDLVILDSRPMEEYTRMNIPGGVNVPGGELVFRIQDLAPSKDTLVVVNCAGRTRSIIGAQSLINAGVPNKVVALRNGTMGWHLAGLALEKGKTRRSPEPGGKGIEWARGAAERVARRFGVRRVDHQTLEQWRAEEEERTLYLLDVRLPEAYESGHMAGTRNAPGGQLVQGTDTYMATRGSRVVLVDTHQVRALMTASWLVQMGWDDVSVLEGGMLPFGLEQGPAQVEIPGLEPSRGREISPAELAEMLAGGAEDGEGSRPAVVDFADSDRYQAGHIPGAVFVIRSRISEDLAGLPAAPLVLTSPDGVLARLAAPEVEALGKGEVFLLRGGSAAWKGEGRPWAAGPERMASKAEDVFPKPYDRPGGVEEAMREYLDWEVDLVRQIEDNGDASFDVYPPD